MRIRRAFLYWGAFFLAMGAVMVVADRYVIDDGLVSQVLRLWPLAFIALGLGLVLRGTRLRLAGGMLAATVPGLVLGGVIVAAPHLVTFCGDGQAAATADHQQGVFAGPASVDITMRCGDVAVTTGPGAGWQLDTGGSDGPAAVVSASSTRLSVTSRPETWLGRGHAPDHWQLTLPTSTVTDLALEVDAGAGRLDLAGAQVGNLALVANAADARIDLTGATINHVTANLNAGSVALRLPAEDDLVGVLTVNAGALKVCAPSGLGLRIHGTTTLASATYPGLVRSGDTWQSPDYATASHHAELTVTVNLGSVELNPTGGCQ